MVVLDDCGFAQLGCFGSEIETTTIDGLAQDGVRMNAFHVTALGSPSIAAAQARRSSLFDVRADPGAAPDGRCPGRGRLLAQQRVPPPPPAHRR
jgi:arylsulfatase A-like enzyme